MAFLELAGIQKFYGTTHVVKNFDLSVEQGEFISFLGPSGCGKTTTLRMVAGFEIPTEGAIRIAGRDVSNLKPNQRNIGMVFQSYALFPNMTVAQNTGFGLRVSRTDRTTTAARVKEMLGLVGLADFGARYPFQLSGGQQQRVALARALAGQPQLLLLDEPLSALDAKIRVSLREEIRRIQQDLGITTIYVTHDQEEALSMSDRIVVMNAGVAEQVGTPFEIYNRPATAFVASFVGHLSRIPATVSDAASGVVSVDGQPIALGRPVSARAGDTVSLDLRPEMLEQGIVAGHQTIAGVVEDVAFLGSVVRIRLAAGAVRLSLDTFNKPGSPPPKVGDRFSVSFDPANVLSV
jgi:putative spermidine/putrescine transport system ATP-binding protein